MKQQHYIFALLAIGSAIVLYLLWQDSQQTTTAANPDTAAPEPEIPSYPAAQAPVTPGNVIIASPGSTVNMGTPPQQNYNVTPTDTAAAATAETDDVKVSSSPQSDCGCEDNSCEEAGTAVTTQSIPQNVLDVATINLGSFQQKTTSAVASQLSKAGTPKINLQTGHITFS